MKTHIKMGVAVFLLSILSVAGIKSPKIKAEMIDSFEKLYEITDVEIDGHTYQAIMYSINESNGKKEIRLLGLHTEEDTIYIPESIDGMPVTVVGGGKILQKRKQRKNGICYGRQIPIKSIKRWFCHLH